MKKFRFTAAQRDSSTDKICHSTIGGKHWQLCGAWAAKSEIVAKHSFKSYEINAYPIYEKVVTRAVDRLTISDIAVGVSLLGKKPMTIDMAVLKAPKYSVKINANFLHPIAEMDLYGGGSPTAPIAAYRNGEIMAFVMPLRF